MAAKAGKKGKKKGTTMALTDFLSDEQGNVAGPVSSYVLANKPVDWATEMDELDNTSDSMYGSSMMPAVNRAKLPTGPKASRGPEDLERVPTQPPFKAFIGNLPYEVSEQSIEEFFKNLPVVNVQLVLDSGRFKGFGYVEFETRQALIDALGMSEEMIGGRKARIDLADKQNDGGSKGGRHHDDGQPDRTEGDWRREGPPAPSQGSRYEDRGGSSSRGGFDRESRGGFEDRGPRRGFEDRGSRGGFEDRGSRGGFEDRGGSRGGFEDRGGSRGGFEDRGSSRGFGRRDDRDGGFRGGDRFDDRGPSRGGFEDREGGGRRGYGSSFERDRGGFGGDRGYDREHGSERGGSERGWERSGQTAVTARPRDDRPSGYERAESREPANTEAPKERPRLQLQPRSKPAEQASGAGAVPSSSIFGSAKPVDTAQREREIEERLLKKKVEPEKKSSLESRGYGSSRGYEEPAERRPEESKNMARADGAPRRRSDSDKSQEGDGRRERRSSGRRRKTSGSSGGRSHDQGPTDPVSPGGEDDRGPVSPALREEPKQLVPAPPPKENIWEKRKHTAAASSSQSGSDSRSVAPTSPAAAGAAESYSGDIEEPRSPTQQSPSQQGPPAPRAQAPAQAPAGGSESAKKEFVPAEPPKENPWMKRRQEQSGPHQPRTGGDGPSPAAAGRGSGPGPASSGAPAGPPNAWAGRGANTRGRGGRGAGPGAGRGRGDQKPKEKRERPLPQSIDEMPKLENKSKKEANDVGNWTSLNEQQATPKEDFSDSNKFAGLIDDDDGDYEVES